jgi:hypothetical protein
MRTPEDIVRAAVHYCVSSLVAELAKGYGGTNEELGDIAEAAFELSTPVADYEEAAVQAGWTYQPKCWTRAKTADDDQDGGDTMACSTAQEACEIDDVEPYDREVFEHWIVSDWLADQLAERGEKVDKDFYGLTVWARTTTGQAIASDSVMEDIVAALNAS